MTKDLIMRVNAIPGRDQDCGRGLTFGSFFSLWLGHSLASDPPVRFHDDMMLFLRLRRKSAMEW